ncbi:putative ribosome biogenesis protein slx9-like isoform X2 [Tripterygium wilfordii]|uniref:Putative ribosome biogenesis protein slx9-like isoform X2 n=1 Tax=Tripterygium wilfordii TaxID=458696 RepID=A0A7J7DY52_TRIWF|nr:uncharacterized protein LOC120007073 [Tripterygium wilfordii]KAF5751181.1 putative ribosome biogenesis protein slx9-like isoform X2 [Tripterygium wilfordii]
MVFTKRSGLSTKEKRILEKTRQFKTKIKDTSAALNVKTAISKKKVRSRQKKLKAYDLSNLSEFLPELKTVQLNTAELSNSKLNCKSRQKLILKEGKQLCAVLNHPVFQSDPLAAIHQHLQMTQPVEKPDRKMNKNKKKEMKKKSKASTESQSMDM